MARGGIATTLRGFTAGAEKRDVVVRLSNKNERTTAGPEPLDLGRVATTTRHNRGGMREGECALRLVSCHLLRYYSGRCRTRCGASPQQIDRVRRQRADADAFVGVAGLLRAENSPPLARSCLGGTSKGPPQA